MKCPKCKAELGAEDLFCPQCGFKVGKGPGEEAPGQVKEAAGGQEASEKESGQQEASEKEDGQQPEEGAPYKNPFGNPYGDPYKNPYGDPYGDLYGSQYKNPYENPYKGSYKDYNSDPYYDPYKDLEKGSPGDPYKSITDEKKQDVSSEASEDPYKKDANTGDSRDASKNGSEQGRTGSREERERQASEEKRAEEARKAEKAKKAAEAKKAEEEKRAVEAKKAQEASKPKKKSKKGKFFLILLLAVCVGAGYWMGKGDTDLSMLIEKCKSSASVLVAKVEDMLGKEQDTPTEPEADTVMPTAAPEADPANTPADTPEATSTPTPEPELVWQGEVTSEEQDSVMIEGTWLDKTHMASLMDQSGARYGLYVMDLTNWTYYGGGESETPLPASALIGIPIMFTIAEGISTNAFSMDDLVRFTYTFVNGRGNIKADKDGQYYTLGELLKEALLYSDNNALNSLIDYLTLDRINSVCHQYGFNSVDMQRKLMTESSSLENYISPKDAAMMINAIYQNNFTDIDRAFLKSYFMLTPGDSANKGMYPACGSCQVFLNLNGITDSRYNEVGLVENGDEVFIMAVMTVDGKQENSAPCVTNVAKYVLDNLKIGER